MKFFCPQCRAKYKIDDEKVRGRTLKMKCRQCGAEITIHENMRQPSDPPQPFSDTSLPKPQGTAARNNPLRSRTPSAVPGVGHGSVIPVHPAPTDKLFPPRVQPHPVSEGPGSRPHAAVSASTAGLVMGSSENQSPLTHVPQPQVWHVGINGVTIGPMSYDELGRKIRNGAVALDSLIWKQGWPQWMPLNQIDELGPLFQECQRLGPVNPTPVPPQRYSSIPPAAPSIKNVSRIPSLIDASSQSKTSPSPPERTSVVKWSDTANETTGDAVAFPSQRPTFEKKRSPLPIGAWIAIAGSTAFGITLALIVGKKMFSDARPIPKLANAPVSKQAPRQDTETPGLALESNDGDVAETRIDPDRKRAKRDHRSESKKLDVQKNKLSAEQKALLNKMGGDDTGGPKGMSELMQETSQPKGEPLSADQLRSVITKNRPALQRCYEVAARGTQQAGAVRLDVEITIGTSGVVLRVAAEGKEFGNIKDCIEDAIKKWRFPSAGETTETTFPVVFQPGN